jgi:hypothetical protein
VYGYGHNLLFAFVPKDVVAPVNTVEYKTVLFKNLYNLLCRFWYKFRHTDVGYTVTVERAMVGIGDGSAMPIRLRDVAV